MTWQLSEDGEHFIFDGVVSIPHNSGLATLVLTPTGEPFGPLLPVEMVESRQQPIRQPVDIIDEIDQLVEDTMAGGEPRQGYDYGDPQYPRCHHCGRHWHGLAITERIATMYANGRYDEGYRADEDDSPVLCAGSDFIGPMPQRARASTSYVDQIIGATLDYAMESLQAVTGLGDGWHLLGAIREGDE